MAALATLMAPAIGYGVNVIYTADSNATTSCRVERWGTATTSATDTTGCDGGWDGGTASTGSVTTGIIQFRTLDNPFIWQQTEGVTYRVYDGNYPITWEVYPTKTPKERLREILDSRMAPGILSSCKPLGMSKDIREIRARETLLRVLGEDKFRDFIRRGHVTVRAKSGLVYQIFPGHGITSVYDRGTMVERLCVVLTGDFPPTDSLIMRYLMILNNEQQFRGFAIKHGVIRPELPKQVDERSLPEIFRELKKVA
jgi:hypothetical protein